MSIALDTKDNYIIIGNYGNDTLALIQWAYEHALPHITVLSVDTGWAAPDWDAHVTRCETLVQQYGYHAIRLVSPTPFASLMQQRGHFPTTKFQWCANVLKGIPILTWLDQHDASGTSIILLGHRRASARSKEHLSAHIPESETYGEREVYYPLLDLNTFDRNVLLARAGFSVMPHRSLECDPCVNSDVFDLAHLSRAEIERLNNLEIALGKTMFAHFINNSNGSSITELTKTAKKTDSSTTGLSDVLENMGCGDPYGCGI